MAARGKERIEDFLSFLNSSPSRKEPLYKQRGGFESLCTDQMFKSVSHG